MKTTIPPEKEVLFVYFLITTTKYLKAVWVKLHFFSGSLKFGKLEFVKLLLFLRAHCGTVNLEKRHLFKWKKTIDGIIVLSNMHRPSN